MNYTRKFKDAKKFKKLRNNVQFALEAMGRKVVEDHRRTGTPLIVMEGDKIVEKNPWTVKI